MKAIPFFLKKKKDGNCPYKHLLQLQLLMRIHVKEQFHQLIILQRFNKMSVHKRYNNVWWMHGLAALYGHTSAHTRILKGWNKSC